MPLSPYLARNFSMADDTCAASLTGTTSNSASAPPASIRIDGFSNTFLYHCVSDPCAGNRYSFLSSATNQIGMVMVRPDFLPVTLMLISRDWDKRSFKASLRASLFLIQMSFSSGHDIVRR